MGLDTDGNEHDSVVRRTMRDEFGVVLPADEIDDVVTQVMAELVGAITDDSLVAAASGLCRLRLSDRSGRGPDNDQG